MTAKSQLRNSVLRSVAGLFLVGLVTFICFGLRVNLAATAFLYLFVIVLLSLAGDFRSTVVVSFAAALALDFFFTPPVLSFAISSYVDIVALASFLITGIVITRLTTGLHGEATRAESHARSMMRLYELAQTLLVQHPDKTIDELLAPFCRIFQIRALCLFVSETAALHQLGDSQHGLAESTRYGYIAAKDSDHHDLETSVRCLRTSDGVIGAIGFEGLSDVGQIAGPLASLAAIMLERKQVFERASHSAAAEKAEVFRGAILDALAHEFKTPLATITAAADGLAAAGTLCPEQCELAEIVETEASRLSSLTSRLLRTARLDKEEVTPRLEPIDLHSIVSNTIRQYSKHWTDHVFQVNSPGAMKVLADSELIRLALSQLLENACKYSRAGSGVGVTLSAGETFVTARVWNEGSVIEPKERSLIFDRFSRGAGASRCTAGSGLGLYVTRKIALAHGGDLELDPETSPGGGTTFCLSIPKAEENPDNADRRVQRSGCR
jgi:two-component system, OmpR family, sensor histidine kinase KdpD